MACNIILVDDHMMLRGGIKSFLTENSDFSVKFEASSLDDCEKIAKEISGSENPDDSPENYVAVVDILFRTQDSDAHYDENRGFEIIKLFSKIGIRCIAFSSHDSGGYVEHALELGAKGFVSKNSDERILLEAIKMVANGKTYIQSDLVTNLLEVRDIIQTFTKKEKSILYSLDLHKTNAEMANELGLNEKTFCNYLSVLYDKTGTENKIQLLEKLGRI